MRKSKILSLFVIIYLLISIIFGIKSYSATAACDMILTYEGNSRLTVGEQKEISIIITNISLDNGIVLYNGVLEYDSDKFDVQVENSNDWELYYQKDNNITLVSQDLENKKADQIIGKILITAKEEIELNGNMIKLVKGDVTDGEKVASTSNSSLINIEYSTKELTNKNVIVKITSDAELEKNDGWTISSDRKILQKEYEKNIQENVIVKFVNGRVVTFNIKIDNIDKTAPKIEGVEEGKQYINSANLKITDENLTKIELVKNGNIIQGYKQGEIIGEGKYTIKALDAAGNERIVNFEIKEDTLINLKIERLPEKLKYYKGDTLETKGLIVIGEYYSGVKEEITEYTCSPSVLNEIGKQNITVAWKDFETTFEVEVEEIKLIGIEIKKLPNKIKYEVGENLNANGLIIIEKYNNGTEIEVKDGIKCSPIKLDTAGEQEIVVDHKNFKATFNVKVEVICDVILFWGQSNMRGSVGNYNKYESENKIDSRIPTEQKALDVISAQTGIKEEFLYIPTSTNDSTNINKMNYTKIEQQENSTYEFFYLDKDQKPNGRLSELSSKSNKQGEYLYFNSDGELVVWTGQETEANLLQKSYGTNMIPAFCAQYYKKTKRKVVAVMCAKGGQVIANFEPGAADNKETENVVEPGIYEAMTTKYNAAIKYLEKEGYTIGNKLYVAFQGESDVVEKTSKEAYMTSFRKIDDALETNCGITKGAIVETGRQPGYSNLEMVKEINSAQVELIKDSDIILGSTFPYKNYIPDEDTYNDKNYTNSKYVDENGKKLDYDEAFKIASYSVSDNEDNSVHFTSAALSQIGYETANRYVTYSLIRVKEKPKKIKYYVGEELDYTGIKIERKTVSNIYEDITEDCLVSLEEGKILDTVGEQKIKVTYNYVDEELGINEILTTEFTISVEEAELDRISIEKTPLKTEYIEGEKFDGTGMVVVANYNNGTSKPIQNYTITPIEKLTVNDTKITIAYSEDNITKMVEQPITVRKKSVESIAINTLPNKTAYIENDILKTEGLTIKVVYDNKTEEIVSDGLVFTPKKLSVVGTQIITVAYEGKTTTFEVKVAENTLEKIEIASKPSKTSYIVGDTLVTDGLKIKATYKNGNTKELTTGFECSPKILETVGTQIITVTYGGKTTTFEVKVAENTLEKIEMESKPSKTSYIVGDTLVTDGLKIKATYKNGNTKELTTGFECSPKILETVGTQIITVTYEGKTATFEVTVEENTLEKIEIVSNPSKTSYIVGDTLVTDGLKIKATYKNGNTKELTTGFACSPKILEKAGTQTITVEYCELTTMFEVEVEDIELERIYVKEMPYKTEYIEGQYFDKTGMVVIATYNNGDYREIENYTIAPTEKLTLNDTKITITHTENGITQIAEQPINVKIKEVEKIQINTLPIKNTYFVGENLETEGVSIKVIHNDKTEEVISEGFTCNPTKLEVAGTQKITVEYEGKITEFKVAVQAIELIAIEIKQEPTRVEYIEGQYFDKTGMVIVAKYNDGNIREITNYSINLTEKLTPEDNKVIISYFEGEKVAKVEQSITVREKTVESIAINTLPNKISYFEGQNLETDGLTIKVVYDNKDEEILSEGFTCTPMQLSKVGNETITVEYEGNTATYEVKVIGLELTGIKIKNYPIKLDYELGDILNTQGLEIIAIYNNIAEKVITEGFECTPKILNESGKQEITVSYQGFMTTFEVNVRKIESIRIKNNPKETRYFVGEVLDTRGLVLTVKYTDGTEEEVTKGYTCTPQILDKAGQQQIIVKYKDCTASFEVKVMDVILSDLIIKSNPTKTVYYEGEILDTQGLEVAVRFNDGTEKVVEDYTCNLIKLTQPGKQEVMVSYQGMNAIFEIEVKAIELEKINIKTAPNKTEYVEGEYFDNTGMTVEAEYNNGDVKEITNYIVETTSKLNLNDTNIIISYIENKAKVITKQPIKVVKKTLETIEIISLPNQTTYYEGEILNLEGLKVVAKYNNKDIIDITNNFLNQQIVLTQIGNQEIALKYEGKTAIFTVFVKEKLKVIIKEHEEIISETENYIANINPDIKIEELLNNIETNKDAIIKIFKGENEIINKEEKLATGMRIEITLGEQKIVYTVIVNGDATGDGNIDIQDMIKINTYRLFGTTTNFEWMYQQAADVNKDGNKDIQDMIKINTYRLFGTKF